MIDLMVNISTVECIKMLPDGSIIQPEVQAVAEVGIYLPIVTSQKHQESNVVLFFLGQPSACQRSRAKSNERRAGTAHKHNKLGGKLCR